MLLVLVGLRRPCKRLAEPARTLPELPCFSGTKESHKVPTVVAPPETIVLVVEDDPQLRVLYRSGLRAAGYAVVAVEDGLDALRFAEQVVPSAVVLDLGLPRLAGRDVGRELAAHEHTRHVPVIVVTGETGTIDETCYACVIRKPFHVDELVEAVRRCLLRVSARTQ